MEHRGIARSVVAAALAVCLLPAGGWAGLCRSEGDARACCDRPADKDWVRYAPPSGWSRWVPPQGVTVAPWMAVFYPAKHEEARLDIWKITDEVPRNEYVPALYAYALECGQRGRCAEAQKRGQAAPAFSCEGVAAPALGGGARAEGLISQVERDGKARRSLVYFITTPDGRRFRVLYQGEDPGFARHREAIAASLRSLSFPAVDAAPPPLSRAQLVAELRKHLDGGRLWIEDGKVAGRRLSDEHLAALSDPAFAGVTDLNLFSSGDSISTGVDVTDAGLAHLARLPLKSLCLRGSLVTDAGLERLKGMPLETLVLAHTLVTGEGLRHLRGLPLKVLDVDHTRIGDESLGQLDSLPLVMLHVRETRCTKAGVDGLRVKMSKVIVGCDPG